MTFNSKIKANLSPKRISSGDQYVIILQGTIGWRKSKVCWFGSGNWFWVRIHARIAEAGEGAAALCTSRKECNKYDLTEHCCSMCPILYIKATLVSVCVGSAWKILSVTARSLWSWWQAGQGGQGGCTPHLFVVPLSLLWVALHKST
jgi:hypothetical protein